MTVDLLQPLRVVIVDDEELARLRLRTLLGDCVAPPALVVGELASAMAALQWLGQHRCDVLLLDIHLPGLDGLQLAQRLRAQTLVQAPAVVFVTAYSEHALAAFDVEAVDYLTKPVRRARLQEALVRAANWLGRRVVPGSADQTIAAALLRPSTAGVPAGADVPVILVHQQGALLRVPVDEVLYLKAEQKYVQLRTAQGSHWLDESLTELSERLGERFLRIHRNALVARRAVRELARVAAPLDAAADAPAEAPGDTGVEPAGSDFWAVRVVPVNEWLQVSRRQLAQVRALLDDPRGD
ncbi:MAG: response regulator transcription factor [Burkholderiales bacterium]|nr:response regulator transcription factor [Burkholderiales bacterium]